MQVYKEGPLKSTDESLRFFKKHLLKLGKIEYIVLYYAEREWLINRNLYHQYVIVVGEEAQAWMSGFTWEYYGTGPYGLFELMKLIDSSIKYEEIVNLEWMAHEPIMFVFVDGNLPNELMYLANCSTISYTQLNTHINTNNETA